MKQFVHILSLVVLIWFIGFFAYATRIQFYPQTITNKPEAIVVLTGGSNRIEEGLDIMSKFGCRNLFISGVNRNVTRHDILKRIQKNKEVEQCQVELGYKARNTHENAQEVISWLEKKRFKKIVLVTANYHLPRAILEFRAINPALEIESYAVVPDEPTTQTPDTFYKKIWLLFKEYHKYIAAWVRLYFI